VRFVRAAMDLGDAMIRTGVLTPHTTVGPEEEFPAMAPGRVLTCVARVSAKPTAGGAGLVANPTTPSALRDLATPPLLDEAADMFLLGDVAAIAYASTSTGYALGFDDEAALVSRLSRRIGIPVFATCASAVLALCALEVERIALVHPPWFGAELKALGRSYFQGEGFEVVSSVSAAVSLDPDRVEPAAVTEWTSRHVDDDAEAVFIGGNGFRAAGAIAPLEAAIGRPVLTSNQVLLWNLLAQARDTAQVSGFGQLFQYTTRSVHHAGRHQP
jgi:maleate isomerase